MSAHPCPCGHATLGHGPVGCTAPDVSTRTGACDCIQTFRDLMKGRKLTSLVIDGEQVLPRVGGVITADNLRMVGETPTAKDSQVGGDHYRQHSIQPWDIWEEYGLNAFEGAVLKYLLRRKESRVEDLKKARHTLDRLIEIEEAKEIGVLRPPGEEAE